MTNENIIKQLKRLIPSLQYADDVNAVKGAIQALSQEPTFDDECQKDMDEAWEQAKELSQEPICDRDCEHCTWTECPIEPCEDVISRKAVLKLKHHKPEYGDMIYAFDVEQLPSVTQKSGKWICIDDYRIGKFKCSVCQTEGFPNTVMYKPTWNYCPNCGAKMVEPQESEDK